jgi:PilZ domain
MEHRWGHRRKVSRIVHLLMRSGREAPARIRNVSISGAFIVSPLCPELLSHVRIRFTPTRRGLGNGGVVEAQVVRREDPGFAVEWCELAPPMVRALVRAPLYAPVQTPASRGHYRRG